MTSKTISITMNDEDYNDLIEALEAKPDLPILNRIVDEYYNNPSDYETLETLNTFID